MAEGLSRFDGGIRLDGLSELADDSARILSTHHERLSLRGLTELSCSPGHVALATALCKGGRVISLDCLTNLPDEIAVIFGGIFAYHNNSQEQSGNGELIAAQEGDYKVAPEDPQGKQFEGEGDAAFAASEGKSRESNAMPAKPAPPEPKATPAAAASSAAAGANAPASGGVLVQLAALNSEAAAEQQWSKLSGQYEYLKDMRHRVVKAEVEGRTVYRLSAVSSDRSNANNLCNRIKSDGGSCLIAG